MTASEKSLRFAVRNVATHGDTDVFPFPLENHWFHDHEQEVLDILLELDKNFDNWTASYPIHYVRNLSAVGYSGFRGATQIDPLWNAYLLALVYEIGQDIESARIPAERNIVFSYRYQPSEERYTLFDSDFGWTAFQRAALTQAAAHEAVLSTDISDFYARVYHHRLENALRQATRNHDAVKRIMTVLSKLAPGGVSYGLPVGGHAARLLAELLLNRVDRLLLTQGVRFCRFVDDYYLFANSREEAQSALVFMSEVLLTNEGLTLSRAKTRFMSCGEFQRLSPVAESDVAESQDEAESRRFLRIRLVYDPYSATADNDYEELSEQLSEFDIIGMLARELRKSRVDERLMRQLIKSLRFLPHGVRDAAILSLARNFNVLYPVFPTVVIVLRTLLPEVSPSVKDEVLRQVRELVRTRSYIVEVPANLAFALRLLAQDLSEETTVLLADLYHRPRTDMMLKRDILLAMARRRADYWLSDILKRFEILSPWEKRALIIASYLLGDEGKHWRDRVRPTLSPVDQAFMRWVGSKNSGRIWELPL